MYRIAMLLILLLGSTYSYGYSVGCSKLFERMTQDQGLGTLANRADGITHVFDNDKKRLLSKSKKLGKRDVGPTVALYPDGEGFKIVRTLGLNDNPKGRSRAKLFYSYDCSELSLIQLTKRDNGVTSAEITADRCKDPNQSFLPEQIEVIDFESLCSEFFPGGDMKQDSTEVRTSEKSTVRE